MSLYAMSWALAASGAAGNDRLVVIVMAHHADENGYAALSKTTLSRETRLSESTILRSQQSLVRIGDITRVVGDNGPQWWLEIPKNRRPKLYEMTAYLGSQFATPSLAGASQGSHRGVSGVHATPSDQDVRDAKVLTLERTKEAGSGFKSDEEHTLETMTPAEREARKAKARAALSSLPSHRQETA